MFPEGKSFKCLDAFKRRKKLTANVKLSKIKTGVVCKFSHHKNIFAIGCSVQDCRSLFYNFKHGFLAQETTRQAPQSSQLKESHPGMRCDIMSMGSGKMIVEFFSADIEFNV